MPCFPFQQSAARRSRRAGFRGKVSVRPTVECLEGRWVPSTVMNLNDGGPGSLRQAILDADANPGTNIITFAPGLTGTIALASGLPNLQGTIDVQGPGAASIQVSAPTGPNAGPVFPVAVDAAVSISGLTITGGSAGINIDHGIVTVTGCTIANSATGIWDFSDTNLTVSNCTIADNSANGIYISWSAIGTSGVLAITSSLIANNGDSGIVSAGTLMLTDSTVSGNTAPGSYSSSQNIVTGGITTYPIGGHGGGILNAGTAVLINSTVTGNVAQGKLINVWKNPGNGYDGGQGGGIWNSGNLTLINSTVAGNADYGGSGGGVYNNPSGTVTVYNTIIAGNALLANPPNTTTTAAQDVAGAFVSQGHNLISAADGSTGFGATGDQVGTTAAPIDPGLGPLQNNGGPTPTMALQPSSPAIGGGSPVNAPTTDQRGQPRTPNPNIDIGAYESQGTNGLAQRFVTQLYHDVLGRTPDPAGFQGWVTGLTVGTVSYAQVAAAVWGSAEHRGEEVEQFYLSYLQRAGSPQECAPGRAP